MHVLTTGAQGFVGKALTWRLLERRCPGTKPLTRALVDLAVDSSTAARVRVLSGGLDLVSAFMSDLIRAISTGEALPVFYVG